MVAEACEGVDEFDCLREELKALLLFAHGADYEVAGGFVVGTLQFHVAIPADFFFFPFGSLKGFEAFLFLIGELVFVGLAVGDVFTEGGHDLVRGELAVDLPIATFEGMKESEYGGEAEEAGGFAGADRLRDALHVVDVNVFCFAHFGECFGHVYTDEAFDGCLAVCGQ